MPTIRDVAHRAGVSVATVSRVVNASAYPISENTRHKVMQAVQELGYEPSSMARGLAGSGTETIGLVMFDIMYLAHPHYSQIVQGVASGLRDTAFDLLLLPLKGKLEQERLIPTTLASYHKRRKVDGLVIGAQQVNPQAVVELQEAGCPAVLHGFSLPGVSLPSVRTDDCRGLEMCVKHLLDLGHTRIGFINGPKGYPVCRATEAGYRSALESRGAYDPHLVVNTDYSLHLTRLRAEQLLALPDPPTALIAADDLMAVELIQWAEDRGLSVPGDVSVVGYGDLPLHSRVKLTTVRKPIAETTRLTVSILLESIESGTTHPADVALPPELIVRETTAPPAN